jgi:glycosyltransferase involved in cell wall biosynthesis
MTKEAIVFVLHNDVHGPSYGGIETYVELLCKNLLDEYQVYTYIPKYNDPTCIVIRDINSREIEQLKFSVQFTNWQLTCDEREIAFQQFIERKNIKLVHFHHLSGHPPSLIKVAKSVGVQTLYTFHDYFGICHISNLISSSEVYCKPDLISLKSCDECLRSMYNILPGAQELRRSYWNELFSNVGTLIFNTEGGHGLASRIYGSINSHTSKFILPVATINPSRDQKCAKSTQKLRVAILGNLLFHKGANTIIEAIYSLIHSNIEFHFFGRIDEGYLAKLNAINSHKVVIHGPYSSPEIPTGVYGCDVSLHVSLCPETFCLTLSEAVVAGLVPIVSDIGALGERVSYGVNGFKIKPGAANELIEILHILIGDERALSICRNGLDSIYVPKVEEHVSGLKKLYQQKFTYQSLGITPQISINLLEPKQSWATFYDQTEIISLKEIIYKRIYHFKDQVRSLFF